MDPNMIRAQRMLEQADRFLERAERSLQRSGGDTAELEAELATMRGINAKAATVVSERSGQPLRIKFKAKAEPVE